jgi:hypothetical protein
MISVAEALTIGESEEVMSPVRTAPGYAWTKVKSGFLAANS